MNIYIKTIPHHDQKYPTVGNWFWKLGDLYIEVSETGNRIYDFLIMRHELDEAFLCQVQGITTKDVDKFDMKFEANRKPGDDSEPGDDSKAPYKREHCFATGMERTIAAYLGVDWKTYEETLNAL